MEALKDILLKPELIWFLVGFVMLMFEFALPGLIIFFFGVGAWIVAAVCLVTEVSLNTQLLTFIAASILSLGFLRTWLKGIFLGHSKSKQDMTQDLGEFVGEHAVVMKKITPKLPGKIELHGTRWAAQADHEIDEGMTVEVIAKENL
ncbi:MAG: NfeD family protein, partial [Planctomycetes bacterium]|nr:NfeD family protein [Planctomycetota bacterium]